MEPELFWLSSSSNLITDTHYILDKGVKFDDVLISITLIKGNFPITDV